MKGTERTRKGAIRKDNSQAFSSNHTNCLNLNSCSSYKLNLNLNIQYGENGVFSGKCVYGVVESDLGKLECLALN